MKQINLKEGEFEKLEDLFGIKFDEESRNAILVDESCDIMACAGSGKTTVLLAKLTLLADRMPFENNKGICVLTHTNVAIDEIRDRLGEKAEKLFKYPNFFGTIQTFVNQYLAIPYYNLNFNKNLISIDDAYFSYLFNKVVFESKGNFFDSWHYKMRTHFEKFKYNYDNLKDFNFLSKGTYESVQKIVNNEYNILRKNQKKIIENLDLSSVENSNYFTYNELNGYLREIFYHLFSFGILRYKDAYFFAEKYLSEFPNVPDIFINRFKYVLIDEMQDTKDFQFKVLNKVFPCSKVIVQKFGDLNQEILDFDSDKSGWHKCPHKSPLPLPKSKRFGENIANIVCDLRVSKGIDNIDKILGNDSKKETTKHPCIILYDDSTLDNVLDTYIDIIEKEKLLNLFENPKFYAISRIGKHKKHTDKHLSLFKYTSNYEKESDLKKTKEKNIFIYIEGNKGSIIHPNEVYDISINTILEVLFLENKKNEDKNSYFNKNTLIYLLEKNHSYLFKEFTKTIIQVSFKVNELDMSYTPQLKNILEKILKDVFAIENTLESILKKIRNTKVTSKKNIYENAKKIPINLTTIHGSKGQTHTATLVLDSKYKTVEEFKYFKDALVNGINTCTYSKDDINYSVKLAYVAMTRPTHLLCLAISKNLLTDEEKEFLKKKNYNFYDAGEDVNSSDYKE